MKIKAIKDLNQLPDNEFFEAVSEGLNHILTNSIKISQDAKKLINVKHTLGYKILANSPE